MYHPVFTFPAALFQSGREHVLDAAYIIIFQSSLLAVVVILFIFQVE